LLETRGASMSCIKNINRFLIPNDVIVILGQIYRYIGNSKQYAEVVGTDQERVVEQTVERDAYFLGSILKLDISDVRSRLIITKDSSPRNKEETTLYNLKDILMTLQKRPNQFGIQSNDILNIVNFVFSHANTPIRFDYTSTDKKSILQSQNMKSKRLIIDEITEEISHLLQSNSFEKITLYLHYFIDFYNIKPFTAQNELASLLLLYLLMIKTEVKAFQYVSFFQLINEDYHNFQTELMNACFNWQEGYSQSLGFVRYMEKLILKGYAKTEEIIKNYKFDQNLNKIENIERTIGNMNEIFTKEEIRGIHPYVSESTINRALINLRDTGYIKPIGKGRSAKWMKIPRGYHND